MLLNDFYSIVRSQTENNTVRATIAFNRAHAIFDGHFPAVPVVPGVCMMQIIREIMENISSVKLKIVTGDNIKFLSIINPEENREVEASISYTATDNVYSINATLFKDTITFFKFKGTFQSV